MSTLESFIRRIENSINERPNTIALKNYPGESHTYIQMADAISRLINMLVSSGLQRGDKIAICAKNSVLWVETYLAAVIGGYIAVLFPSNLSFDEILSMLGHADCDAIFTEGELLKQLSLGTPTVFDIGAGSHSLSQIINKIDCEDSLPFGINNQVHFPERDLDDICTIIYTSGSMGNPKGVMLSVRNISCDVTCYFAVPFTCAETYHLNILLPFNHIYGLIDDALMPLCFGKTSVIYTLPFSPQSICSMLERYKPEYFFTVSDMVRAIVNYVAGGDLLCKCCQQSLINSNNSYFQNIKSKIVYSLGGKFKAFLVGGSSMNPEFEKLMVELIGIPVLPGYGLTECGNLTNNSNTIKIYSCGTPFSYLQMRIDSDLPNTVPGEIQVKGDNVFVGYYNDKALTDAAFTSDGWFRTGDLGLMDQDRYLFITGRCKELIVLHNGENIYPDRVELEMNASLYIKESILTQRGEKLHAIVVPDREKALANGFDAEALEKKIDEVVREASKKLPGFAIINTFELRDEPLERTPKGSLKRYLYSDGIKEN